MKKSVLNKLSNKRYHRRLKQFTLKNWQSFEKLRSELSLLCSEQTSLTEKRKEAEALIETFRNAVRSVSCLGPSSSLMLKRQYAHAYDGLLLSRHQERVAKSYHFQLESLDAEQDQLLQDVATIKRRKKRLEQEQRQIKKLKRARREQCEQREQAEQLSFARAREALGC